MRKISHSIFLGVALLILPVILSANPVWMEGTVTKAPWQKDDRYYLEVNKETYMLIPDRDVLVTKRYKTYNDIWQSEKISLFQVREGARIMMMEEGLIVYRIIVVVK